MTRARKTTEAALSRLHRQHGLTASKKKIRRQARQYFAALPPDEREAEYRKYYEQFGATDADVVAQLSMMGARPAERVGDERRP